MIRANLACMDRLSDEGPDARPVVYYDGGCPVCSREIGQYQRRAGGAGFDWMDVTTADAAQLGAGLTREAALGRMHVRRADGTLVSGAAAFAEIWRGMRGLRWLGRLVGVPPFDVAAEFGYRVFLRVRPLWRRGAPARPRRG
ncbi:DUF393 domain-containing protein [Acidiphilium sp. PA]|uniref:thiol-disulfide oxidoreductase DCC family protein n=1 Tax=Acidiphilium sp. PA TaxID=2871705 RepID=UPI002243C2DC|nr:DUF393 domain-containing protein [Acidiphilium sp. PA]MCW8306606.1 DUF393 domain-containing protein [Acidiphilium sp. PA]